jgi:tripartite-type tricarboxylate transporter receptor subunit TctC
MFLSSARSPSKAKLALGILAFLLTTFAPVLQAEGWPTKTVKILVGFPSGSSPDILARLLSDELSKKYKQPFIVENRPGAGGLIALKQMVQANDDHLLLVSPNGPLTTSPLLYKSMDIGSRKDYQPISFLASSPLVFVVASNSSYKGMSDVAIAMQQKGLAITYGSVGAGSGAHLATELLLSRLKTTATHVPFTGFPQVATAIVGGQIDGAFVVPSIAKPLIASGRLKALGLSSKTRSSSMADVDPVQSLGTVGEFDLEVWNGVIAPAKLSRTAAKELSENISLIIRSPEARAKLDLQGWKAIGGTADALANRIQADTAALSRIVTDLKLTLESN